MRIPRSIQLHPASGAVHLFWRCHNREFYLRPTSNKTLYLRCIKEGLKPEVTNDQVAIHSYCIMDNHFHSTSSYQENSRWLSNFMRHTNSLFGSRFNRIHGRTGKVSEGRPKTPLIEDTEHLIRVHFYVEANPIRAGKCTLKQLKFYRYSSYRFYAYGIRDEYTSFLTHPAWYLSLGTNAKTRQHRYRELFKAYLTEVQVRIVGFFQPYIGSSDWMAEQQLLRKTLLQDRKKFRPPVDSS